MRKIFCLLVFITTIIACNTSETSRYSNSIFLFEQAMRNTQAGHEINNDGTPFVFNGFTNPNQQWQKGGTVDLGAAFNIASWNHKSRFYKTCGWGLYGKEGACGYPDEKRNMDRYCLTGGLFIDRNNPNPNTLINVRNYRAYVLYKGENVWRRINFPKSQITDETPIRWSGAYDKDYVNVLYKPGDSNSFGFYKPIQRNGYSVIPIPKSGNYYYYGNKWCDAKVIINHFGTNSMNIPKDIDLSRVEGLYITVDVRLDPSTPDGKVGMDISMNGGYVGIEKPWAHGFGVSRVITIAPQWKTINWINYEGGQGARDCSDKVLSKERILSTTLPND